MTRPPAFSTELRVMRAPMSAYAALGAAPRRVPPLAALRRPLLVAAIVGCATAIAATGHVTLPLVAATTIAWSFAVLLQLVIALLVIAAPARRGVGVATALDAFFAAHGPWSLWMLTFAAWTLFASAPGRSTLWAVDASILVPAVWTARLVYAFNVGVLRLDRGAALRRTIVQQALTWGTVLVFAGWAVQVWPRLLAVIGR